MLSTNAAWLGTARTLTGLAPAERSPASKTMPPTHLGLAHAAPTASHAVRPQEGAHGQPIPVAGALPLGLAPAPHHHNDGGSQAEHGGAAHCTTHRRAHHGLAAAGSSGAQHLYCTSSAAGQLHARSAREGGGQPAVLERGLQGSHHLRLAVGSRLDGQRNADVACRWDRRGEAADAGRGRVKAL